MCKKKGQHGLCAKSYSTFFYSNKETLKLTNVADYIKLAKVLIELTNKRDILLPRLGYAVLFPAVATLASS